MTTLHLEAHNKIIRTKEGMKIRLLAQSLLNLVCLPFDLYVCVCDTSLALCCVRPTHVWFSVQKAPICCTDAQQHVDLRSYHLPLHMHNILLM